MREKGRKMATFGDLKNAVLARAGVGNHFDFLKISHAHRQFWDMLNRIEFKRGYVPGEYETPGSPSLWEMDLLTDTEYAELLKDFDETCTCQKEI